MPGGNNGNNVGGGGRRDSRERGGIMEKGDSNVSAASYREAKDVAPSRVSSSMLDWKDSDRV